MSAHGLLKFTNELRKIDNVQGLPSILSLYCNELNTFYNTGARMLDYIYHMILTVLKTSRLCRILHRV